MKELLVMVVFFAGITPLAFGEVYIENDRQYVGDDGSFHVVGEVKNDLQAPLSHLVVNVSLFDKAGNLIATEEAKSFVNTVMPGMTSPFDLIITNNNIDNIDTYKLDLDYRISAPKSQVIDIIDSQMTRDNHDNLMITGIVTNKGEITANTVAVVATLYDNNGDVAAVARVNPEPDYLRSDGDAFFLISVPDKMQTSDVSKYVLVAESEEYAAVPEFPISIAMILLAVTLLGCIIATRCYSEIFIKDQSVAVCPA